MRNVVSGTIRLSTVYSIGLHELPPYLKRFLREFPSVNVHVEYRRSNQVYDEVSEGTSGPRPRRLFPCRRRRSRSSLSARTAWCSSACPTHELAKEGEITVGQAAQGKVHRLRARTSPRARPSTRSSREAGLEVNPVMEFDNIETVKRAVEIGAGVSIVPSATVEQEVRDGTLATVEFKGRMYYRPLGIIYKAGRVPFPPR